MSKPSVVVVLPAYNAAKTLERTVAEIPSDVVDALLVVDDGSQDETVEIAQRLGIPTRVHHRNRGYGANQKTCYSAALEMGADLVVMLHPDYQYDPGRIPALLELLTSGRCDVALGSRMIDGGARSGGMPWWKRLGNRALTIAQNLLLGQSLSEYHTGFRAFTRASLARSGFERFEDGFAFDAQMLVSMVYRGFRIGETSCPARYLPEASSVGPAASVRYGLGCLGSSLRYRLNRLGLFPAGWLGGTDPVPIPEHAPLGMIALFGLWFMVARLFSGVDWQFPLRLYDSMSYSWSGLDLVSLSGGAPRPWPVPLIYSLVATDRERILIQGGLGAAAWLALAVAIGNSIRHRTLAILGVLGVLSLGLTAQAVSWDRFIMSESLTITLSVAAVAALLFFLRGSTFISGCALGVLAGLLVITRPITAPAVGVLTIWLLIRSIRRRDTGARFAALLLLVAVAWMALCMPRQADSYRRFENEVRTGIVSAPYDSDAFASVLYGRLLRLPETRAWLLANGAPRRAPAMTSPRFADDQVPWGPFRQAYAKSPDWQEWFESQGGLSVVLRLALDEPSAHIRALTGDLPLIVSSEWGSPGYAEYGKPAPVPPISSAWFRNYYDVVALILALMAVISASDRRRRAATSPLLGAGLAITGASCVVIVASWLLVGIELVRHSVPGPMGLRLGLSVALLGAIDGTLSTRRVASDA